MLAKEGITVNAIAMAQIDTDLVRSSTPADLTYPGWSPRVNKRNFGCRLHARHKRLHHRSNRERQRWHVLHVIGKENDEGFREWHCVKRVEICVTTISATPERLQNLRAWNLALTALHLVQAIVIVLIAGNFAIDVTSTFPEGPQVPEFRVQNLSSGCASVSSSVCSYC